MNYELLLKKAEEMKITSLELYESTRKSLDVGIYESKVDDYNLSEVTGLSIRGIYNGKQGNTFTEKFDNSQIDDLLYQIITSAKIIDSDDEVLFNEKAGEYQEVEMFYPGLETIKTPEIIDLLLKLESKVLNQDKRIKQVMSTNFSMAKKEVKLINSYGLDLAQKSNYAVITTSIMVEEDGDVKTGFDYQIKFAVEEFDLDKLAHKVVSEATGMLKAKKVKSQKYDLIIQNEAMVSLLGALSSSFSGDRVNKGLSKLKDKLGQKTFSSKLTIIDDPLKENQVNSSSFDDEGTACLRKTVVENGVIKTFLHNLKTAKKAGVESTGNGFKPGYREAVDVHPTNFYIQPLDKSQDELLNLLDNGLLITEIAGLHAGMNGLTGDFSLQCSGYQVENGAKTTPINLILIAGNLFTLLDEQIDEIASDLYFSYSGLGAPSILFKEVSISGE